MRSGPNPSPHTTSVTGRQVRRVRGKVGVDPNPGGAVHPQGGDGLASRLQDVPAQYPDQLPVWCRWW